MRNRKSILILTLILALTGTAWYYGWNYFQANEKIRSYFLEKFRPVLNDNFNIESLYVTLGAIHLKNVYLDQPGFRLQIDDVRIGYRFQSLIRHGFRPESIANEITLIHPQIILKSLQFTHSIPADSPAVSPDSTLESHQPDFAFIKHISISHGAVFLQDSLLQPILLGGEINGFINSARFELATLQAEGRFFSRVNKNIRVNARLNLLRGHLHQLALEFDQVQLPEVPAIFLPEKLKFFGGIAKGSLEFGNHDPVWHGRLQVTDGAASWQNPPCTLEQIALEAELIDRDLVIRQSVQQFAESPVTVSGVIHNLFSPEFDLFVETNPVNLKDLLPLFVHNNFVTVTGPAQLAFSIQGTPENLRVQGELKSDNFQIDRVSRNHLKIPFSYANGTLVFGQVHGKIQQNPLKASGKIDLNSNPALIDFQISASGTLLPLLAGLNTSGLKQGDFTLAVTVGGNLQQPEMWGEFDALLLTLKDQPIRLRNFIKYQSNQFTVRSSSTDWEQLRLDGQILEFFEKPVFKIKIENIQTLLRVLYPHYPAFLRELATHITLQGNLKQCDIFAEIERKNQSKLLIFLSSLIRRDSTDHFAGQVIFNPESPLRLRSNFQLSRTPARWEVQSFKIDEFIDARAVIQAGKNDAPIAAEIKIKDAPLANLSAIGFPSWGHRIHGWLWGEIKLDGSLQNPHINGFLAMNQGIFNKVGTYDSELSFNFDNNVFFLREFLIRQDKKTITSARGFFNNRTKEINFYLNSRSFNPTEMLQIAGLSRDALEGNGAFDLRLTRTLDNPKINGTIQITNGKIWRAAFDTLACDFGPITDSAAAIRMNTAPTDSGLAISRLHLTKDREFTLAGWGHIPFSQNRGMQISVTGNGNFLAILPEIDDYFLATRSQGNFALEIQGRPLAPRFTKGLLNISEGYLKLESVFDQIKQIKCQVEWEPDRKFLHLKEISGQVGKELLKITNVEYAHVSGRKPLEPFFVNDWGLNLGILKIETSPHGIPLNIPGVMETGELGWFQVQGMHADEAAYFAGPWQRPVVRGRAILRNLNFTFPLLEVGIDTTSPAVRVLESIDWDLRVTSAQDTRYVRKILSAPDAVYVNLLLNEGGPGLHFQGALNDSSLTMEGEIESNRGNVEYLDFNFRIDHVGARFDRSSIYPFVFGKARTSIVDTLGYSCNLWLTLYMIDPITGEKAIMGRWDEPNLYLELTSDNPTLGATDGQILASLGYSAKNFKGKAPDILGISADNLLFKPIFRPFERTIERFLGLDFVQFRSRITRNWLEKSLSKREMDISNYWLFRNSRVMLGKYVTNRWFFLYTGELESPIGYQPALPPIGLKHTFGLEYQIKPNLLLEMEYGYNSLLLKNKEDTRIMLRHSFPF